MLKMTCRYVLLFLLGLCSVQALPYTPRLITVEVLRDHQYDYGTEQWDSGCPIQWADLLDPLPDDMPLATRLVWLHATIGRLERTENSTELKRHYQMLSYAASSATQLESIIREMRYTEHLLDLFTPTAPDESLHSITFVLRQCEQTLAQIIAGFSL
jgi:hypothetical protein